MLLVKSDENIEAGGLPSQEELAQMARFNEEMLAAGVTLGGEGLHPSSRGARVRLTPRGFDVIDGPFAEAKELIAGYWLLRTASREQALDWLRRVPARDGSVELRPLYDTEDFPVDASEQAGGWREQELAAREAAEAATPPRKPGTKRFILMLKADARTESGALPSEEVLTKMGTLMEEGVRTGALLAGDGLKPSGAGARLRVAGGKASTVDGPFTESKELIAGYTLLQLPSLREAVAFAKRWLEVHRLVGVPEAEIEVRELMEPDEVPRVSPA
ncbi:MAG TPA: YciI family protein [Polyangiaceae bacterium]|nr:YciI family protein [Polyangiaceae bacterium]